MTTQRPPPARLVRRFVSTATLTLAVLLLARLVDRRGLWPVAEASARVLGLAALAWFGHVVLHEGAHAWMARRRGFTLRGARLGPLWVTRFEGRWRLRLTAPTATGAIEAWPRGPATLAQRLRWVAAAGPVATALACIGSTALMPEGPARWASAPGIAAATGAVLLVSSLTPSAWHLRPPMAGTDLDQLLARPPTMAFWLHAVVLEGLASGATRVGQVVDVDTLQAALPAGLAPLHAAWAVAGCDAGRFDEVRARLDALEPTPSTSDWLVADLALTRAFIAELVDGDTATALTLRDRVVEHQGEPWFVWLLDAALAKDPTARAQQLARWLEAAERSGVRPFALAGTAWVRARLQASADDPQRSQVSLR